MTISVLVVGAIVAGFILIPASSKTSSIASSIAPVSNKKLSCDKSLFLVANSTGDGCECDSGYSITSTGTCSKCDTTSSYFSGFISDVCECVDNASLNEDSSCVCDNSYVGDNGVCILCDTASGASVVDGICTCPAGFMSHNTSCVSCKESTGAFLTK